MVIHVSPFGVQNDTVYCSNHFVAGTTSCVICVILYMSKLKGQNVYYHQLHWLIT